MNYLKVRKRLSLAKRINRKFTKQRLENTFTRKERLKCKKDANRTIKKVKKWRRIKKNKRFGIIDEYNCEAIIRLANRGNKSQRKLKERSSKYLYRRF